MSSGFVGGRPPQSWAQSRQARAARLIEVSSVGTHGGPGLDDMIFQMFTGFPYNCFQRIRTRVTILPVGRIDARLA